MLSELIIPVPWFLLLTFVWSHLERIVPLKAFFRYSAFGKSGEILACICTWVKVQEIEWFNSPVSIIIEVVLPVSLPVTSSWFFYANTSLELLSYLLNEKNWKNRRDEVSYKFECSAWLFPQANRVFI